MGVSAGICFDFCDFIYPEINNKFEVVDRTALNDINNAISEEKQYDVDFIPVSLWYSAAINTAQYCEKGDAICVKGRLVQKVQEINGINYHFIEMVGERVVFLSSKNKAEDLIEDKCVETA